MDSFNPYNSITTVHPLPKYHLQALYRSGLLTAFGIFIMMLEEAGKFQG